MYKATSRETILKRLRSNVDKGIPIIGCGAGTGLSAKCEELGGADLLICYNSGKFRMSGRASTAGLLPLGDANTIVCELAAEILPVLQQVPVIAGVFASDPYRDMHIFLKEIRELGYSGVQNYPTVGGFDGRMALEYEQTGFSYDKEVEMMQIARKMDLLTTPYAWNLEQAEKMAKVKADIIVAHCGCTSGGTTGVNCVMGLAEAAGFVQEVHDLVTSIHPEALVICHGGPLEGPEEMKYILEHTNGIAGFYGASSAERLPVEKAIISHIKSFKEVRIKTYPQGIP